MEHTNIQDDEIPMVQCAWTDYLKIWRAVNPATDELVGEAPNMAELEQMIVHYISVQTGGGHMAYDYRTDAKRPWLH